MAAGYQRPEDVDLQRRDRIVVLLIAHRAHRQEAKRASPSSTYPAWYSGPEDQPIETLGAEQNGLTPPSCFIPDEYVVGQVNQGLVALMGGLNPSG